MKKYLIVCGTTKAGSTSLHAYLAEHPDVTGSSVKQTSYFMDKQFFEATKISTPLHYAAHPNRFDEYFKVDTPFFLESTPHYLYSSGTAKRIKAYFSDKEADVQIVFIFRDPVKRFSSWYHYGMQQGAVTMDESPDDFFRKNVRDYDQNAEIHPAYTALITGRYSNFLKGFYEVFPKENIKIFFFEDLIKNPKEYMKTVSKTVGLNESFFNDFDFVTHNKTVSVKSQSLKNTYKNLRGFLLNNLPVFLLNPIINAGKKYITPIYRKVNHSPLKKQSFTPETLQAIEDFYADEKDNFQKITGISPTW